MATRSRWGGVETRQSAVQQKVTVKREAQRTFRVKERPRAEPLSSHRSVQQVFGGEADPYQRASQRLNTTFNKSDDSDSSGGWDRDSLEGGKRHRGGRLAKSVTTANLHPGARESRARGYGLSASRSSTSINEAGVQKPRTKTNNIDRLVDRLSKPQKREPRSGSTDAGPGRRRRSDVSGRAERASPARKGPAVEFRRSNTFDLDDEPEEDMLRVRRRDKKPATPRGRTQDATPPRDFRRSNTFEKDVDEAPFRSGSDMPSVAWPTNVEPEDEDASVFRVNTRYGPEPVRPVQQAGTFTRTKNTERASTGSRWSTCPDAGRNGSVGLRASTENVASLYSRASLATRDKNIMSSTPDLSAFTASRDYNQFPSGKKERPRAKESPDSSVSSVFSRKTRDVRFDDSPSARDRALKGGRADFDEILERASRRRRPSAGSAGGEAASARRGSFSIDRPAVEPGQSSYRSVFTSEDTDVPRVKSSPHVPKLREASGEPGARGFGTPDSAGRGDGYSRHFRGIFNKSRRGDSDESDNSGRDTGFSSGRSNSPRDSMPPDSLSQRGSRPDGARPAGRLLDREATISPSRSQRSSSPSKSGSTTPRRQPSPDRRLTPSPTRSVRSSARSAGSPERFSGSRRASAASSLSEAASFRPGRGRGGAGRAQEQPPHEEEALEAILAQDPEWMRELAEQEQSEQRPGTQLRQPPSLPTRDIDSDSVTAPELVSDSEADFERTLKAGFDRMQLHSTQQEEGVSAHEKQLTSKEDLISFSPAEETLKKRPVAPVGPSPAAPDVARPPSPTPAPAPAPAPVGSAQKQKTQELMLQEKLLKRDREVKTLQDTVAKLKQQLAASQNAQQRMAKMLERHSSSLAQLAASRVQQERQQAQQLQRLTVERNEAREEVANIETMFADLHRKYEKSKALVAENRQSSDLVSAELDHALAQVSREQQRYDMLQQYAEDTMQRLQADMELEQKSQETETLRMSARLQLAENRATKLERENQEVTAICDELIQKMGGAR